MWIVYDGNGQVQVEGNFKEGRYYDKFSDELFTGEVLIYYENGQLRETGNYKDGEGEGEWIVYDENGQISDISIYIDGEWIEDED